MSIRDQFEELMRRNFVVSPLASQDFYDAQFLGALMGEWTRGEALAVQATITAEVVAEMTARDLPKVQAEMNMILRHPEVWL